MASSCPPNPNGVAHTRLLQDATLELKVKTVQYFKGLMRVQEEMTTATQRSMFQVREIVFCEPLLGEVLFLALLNPLPHLSTPLFYQTGGASIARTPAE